MQFPNLTAGSTLMRSRRFIGNRAYGAGRQRAKLVAPQRSKCHSEMALVSRDILDCRNSDQIRVAALLRQGESCSRRFSRKTLGNTRLEKLAEREGVPRIVLRPFAGVRSPLPTLSDSASSPIAVFSSAF